MERGAGAHHARGHHYAQLFHYLKRVGEWGQIKIVKRQSFSFSFSFKYKNLDLMMKLELIKPAK
jgi:hypothetical protein